jgi:membrane-associated phospholipid phosphatase
MSQRRRGKEGGGYVARTPLGWLVERYLTGASLAFVLGVLYFGVGRYTRDRQFDFATAIDEAIPFVPETVWIYFPFYVGIFHVALFTIRDRDVYYRTMASIAIAASLCTVGFLIAPSTMEIPRVDDRTVTGRFLRWVQSIDVPNNTFPSQHVALSFACALGGWVQSRRLGVVLLLMATAIAISTTTTKQHYWIDSPGGMAMAVVGHLVAFRVRRSPEVAAEPEPVRIERG